MRYFVFRKGDTNSCVNISVLNDDVTEPDKTFQISVSPSIGQSSYIEISSDRGSADITIFDDDSELMYSTIVLFEPLTQTLVVIIKHSIHNIIPQHIHVHLL